MNIFFSPRPPSNVNKSCFMDYILSAYSSTYQQPSYFPAYVRLDPSHPVNIFTLCKLLTFGGDPYSSETLSSNILDATH